MASWLVNSRTSFDAKNPVILRTPDNVVDLLAQHEHAVQGQAGKITCLSSCKIVLDSRRKSNSKLSDEGVPRRPGMGGVNEKKAHILSFHAPFISEVRIYYGFASKM